MNNNQKGIGLKILGLCISLSGIVSFAATDPNAWMTFFPIIFALGIIVYELSFLKKK